MRRLTPLILALLATPSLAQSTRPAATKPVWASLAAGEVRYTEPVGWTVLPATSDTSASFKNESGDATITFQATPQQQPLPTTPAVATAVGKQILKAITDDLANSKIKVIEAPKLVRQPKFFVKIHDKIRSNDTPTDRLHLYRPLGYQLLMVTVDTTNPDPAAVKAADAVGEELLTGAVLGKRDPKPTSHKRP